MMHASAQFDPPMRNRCEVFVQVWAQRTRKDPPRAPYIAYRGCFDGTKRLPFPCDAALAGVYEGPSDAPLEIRDIALRVDPWNGGATLYLEASVTVRRRLPEAGELGVATRCDVPGEPQRWGHVQMVPEIRALFPGEGARVREGIYDMKKAPKRCTVDLTIADTTPGAPTWHLARACLVGRDVVPCSKKSGG